MNQKIAQNHKLWKGFPLKQNGTWTPFVTTITIEMYLGPIFLSFMGAFRGATLQVIFLGSSCMGSYLHPMEDSITT
jgi:hypothetical protein